MVYSRFLLGSFFTGQQILDSRQGPRGSSGEPSQGFADQLQNSEDALRSPTPGSPVAVGVNGPVGALRQGDAPTYIPGVPAQPVHLVAVAELERRYVQDRTGLTVQCNIRRSGRVW